MGQGAWVGNIWGKPVPVLNTGVWFDLTKGLTLDHPLGGGELAGLVESRGRQPSRGSEGGSGREAGVAAGREAGEDVREVTGWPRRDCGAYWLLWAPLQGRHPTGRVTRLLFERLALVAVWRIDIAEVRIEMVAATVKHGGLAGSWGPAARSGRSWGSANGGKWGG